MWQTAAVTMAYTVKLVWLIKIFGQDAPESTPWIPFQRFNYHNHIHVYAHVDISITMYKSACNTSVCTN